MKQQRMKPPARLSIPPPFLADFLHACLIAQSCLTPCSPMVCSPPGSSVHGILQARILAWVSIPFSREIQGSNPSLLPCRQIPDHLSHQGSLSLQATGDSVTQQEEDTLWPPQRSGFSWLLLKNCAELVAWVTLQLVS